MNTKHPSEGFTQAEWEEWKRTKPIDKSALDELLDEYNKFMKAPQVMALPEEGI